MKLSYETDQSNRDLMADITKGIDLKYTGMARIVRSIILATTIIPLVMSITMGDLSDIVLCVAVLLYALLFLYYEQLAQKLFVITITLYQGPQLLDAMKKEIEKLEGLMKERSTDDTENKAD